MIRRNFLKLLAGFSLLLVTRARAQIGPETFNIFFDDGKSDLDHAARRLVDHASQYISPRGRVTISGNCDNTEQEPEKLGFARANAVLTQLLRDALMAKVRFNVVNEGAGKPLVETPPNTKEPRNRRVEIILDR